MIRPNERRRPAVLRRQSGARLAKSVRLLLTTPPHENRAPDDAVTPAIRLSGCATRVRPPLSATATLPPTAEESSGRGQRCSQLVDSSSEQSVIVAQRWKIGSPVATSSPRFLAADLSHGRRVADTQTPGSATGPKGCAVSSFDASSTTRHSFRSYDCFYRLRTAARRCWAHSASESPSCLVAVPPPCTFSRAAKRSSGLRQSA
jgi:hypothetical protein